MERDELKKLLKNMGVHENLTEMPAVVEPIYEEFMENDIHDVKSSKRIKVSKDGNFSFDNRNISLEDEGGAIIDFENNKILVNESGIEISHLYECKGESLSITREDGVIKKVSDYDKENSWKETVSLDNGSWSIDNADGEIISTASARRGKRKVQIKLKEEEILSKFNAISSSVIINFPKTAQWYSTTKAGIKVIINEEKINSLEKDIKKLTAQNKDLTGKNEKLSGMLGKSLEFIKEVKKSPVGKIFFHKGLKRYEENTNGLPEGNEENV